MLAGVAVAAVCSSPRAGSPRSISVVPSGSRLTEAYQSRSSLAGVMVTNVPAAAAQGGDQVTELVLGGIVDVVAVLGVGGAVACDGAPWQRGPGVSQDGTGVLVTAIR